jgi:hypothetical protein
MDEHNNHLNERVLSLPLHSNGGEGEGHTETEMVIRDCGIVVKANEHQMLEISRENGEMVLTIWTSGNTDDSHPDFRFSFDRKNLTGHFEVIND